MKIYKNIRGGSLVEFACVASVFLSLIFATFEIGFMLCITTGLEAGLYYGSRLGIIGSDTSKITSLIISEYSVYGLGTISSSNITMTAYPSITDLNNNSNGKSGTGASGQYVLYSATYPYTFMTSYLMPGGTKKSITVNTVVKNEYY